MLHLLGLHVVAPLERQQEQLRCVLRIGDLLHKLYLQLLLRGGFLREHLFFVTFSDRFDRAQHLVVGALIGRASLHYIVGQQLSRAPSRQITVHRVSLCRYPRRFLHSPLALRH